MKIKQTRTLLLLSTVAFVALNSKAYGSSDVMPSSETLTVVNLTATVQAAPGWVGKVTDFGTGSFVEGLGQDFVTQFKPNSPADSAAASSNPTVVSLSKLQTLDRYLQLGLNDQLAAALVSVLEGNTDEKETKRVQVDAFVNALLKAFQDKSAVLETPSADVSKAADIAAEKASLQARSGLWHGFLCQSLDDLAQYEGKIAERKTAREASLLEIESAKAKALAIAAEELVSFMAAKAKAIDGINATAESDTQAQEVLKQGIRAVAASRIETQKRAQEVTLATEAIQEAKDAFRAVITKHFEELDAQMALEIAARDQEIAAIDALKVAALTAEDDKEAAFNSDASKAASELDAKVAADIAGIQSATQADLAILRAEFEVRHGPYVAPVLTKRVAKGYFYNTVETHADFQARQSSVSLKLFNELLADIVPPTVSAMDPVSEESTDAETVAVESPLKKALEEDGYESGDEAAGTSASVTARNDPMMDRTFDSLPPIVPISTSKDELKLDEDEAASRFAVAVEARKFPGNGLQPQSPLPVAPIVHDGFGAGLKVTVKEGAREVSLAGIGHDIALQNDPAVEFHAPTIISSHDIVLGGNITFPTTLTLNNAGGNITFGGGADLSARMFPIGLSTGLVERTFDAPPPSYASAVVLGSGASATETEEGLVGVVPVTRDGTGYSFVSPSVHSVRRSDAVWGMRGPVHPALTVHVGSGAPRPIMMEPPFVHHAKAAEAKPVPVAVTPASGLDMSAAVAAKRPSGEVPVSTATTSVPKPVPARIVAGSRRATKRS